MEATKPLVEEYAPPLDIEDLYSASGFSLPSEPAAMIPGFGESLTRTSSLDDDAPLTGFGSFLQDPSSQPKGEAAGFGGFSNGFETAFPSSATPEDDAPEPIGFNTPAPWGAPVLKKDVTPSNRETPQDDAPSVLTDGFSMANTPSGFDSTEAPMGFTSVNQGEAFGAAESSAAPFGFNDTFPEEKTSEIGSKQDDSGFPANFSFDSSPIPKKHFGSDEDIPRSEFPLPGNSFATGSSPASDAPFGESFFTADDSEISDASDTFPSSDEIFSMGNHSANLFSANEVSNPDTSFFEKTALHGTSASSESKAPFSQEPESAPPLFSPQVNAPAPQIPTEETPSQSPAAGSPPTVTSQPLGGKPKPKVRKGFLVLMVIIIGFACGGALASFVLPVDEYVQTARAFMEQKFNPGAG